MQDIDFWSSKFRPCVYSNRLLGKIKIVNQEFSHEVDLQEIKKAIYYAKKYHGTQTRQTGEPYYSHPLEVAHLLSEYIATRMPQYFNTTLLVTAILHDCLEDTILTKNMISYLFDEQVANQVYDLTRIKKDGVKLTAAQTINSLFKEKKYSVLLIKQFDRLHNIQTIEGKSPEKSKKIVEETLTHFLVLSDMLELPWLSHVLYEECYKHNLKLQHNQMSSIVFDQPFNFSDIPFFQNTTLL